MGPRETGGVNIPAFQYGGFDGLCAGRNAETAGKDGFAALALLEPGDSRQCLAKLIREFNETHEDIEIQANYIADEDFKKRLVLAASEGEQPDLAIVDSSDIQYYDKVGILEDLSTEIREEDYLSRALISCRTKDGGS